MDVLLCVTQQIQTPGKSKKKYFFYYYYRTKKWKDAVDESEKFLDGKNVPCVLVENKVDLLPQNEANNLVSLKGFANANNFLASFRTSAKTGYNINESMSYLIENILQRLSTITSKDFTTDRNSVTLDPSKHENVDNLRAQQKGGCC